MPDPVNAIANSLQQLGLVVHVSVVDAVDVGVHGDELTLAERRRRRLGRRLQVSLPHPFRPPDRADPPTGDTLVERRHDVEHLVAPEQSHRSGGPRAAQRPRSVRRDVGSDEVAGEAVPVPAVDRRLARAQARQYLPSLPRLAQAAVHQLRQQALAGVRGQHADPRIAGCRESRPTGNRGLEPERPEVADASIAVPRAQPVAVGPRGLAGFHHLVAGRAAEQCGPERIGGLTVLVLLDGTDVDLVHP